MRNIKLLTLLAIGLMVAPFAYAQEGGQVDPYGNPNPGYQDPNYGNPGSGNPAYQDPNYGNPSYPNQGYADQGYYVDPGPPPVCPYGYYSYYPYACAPYGYYGPSWFSGGVFIGVGPWGWGGRGYLRWARLLRWTWLWRTRLWRTGLLRRRSGLFRTRRISRWRR